MKKLLFIIAAATLMISAFAGCDNNRDGGIASDISSTVSRVESETGSMLGSVDNVSSESH